MRDGLNPSILGYGSAETLPLVPLYVLQARPL